jgi:hypothetical protein
MDLHTWLDQPENSGKASWLAQEIDRSKTAVSLWRTEGVPLALIPKIAELIGRPVTVEAMLMHAMRCKLSRPPETKAAA